ncbi:MAG: UDP-N-acetylmuramoyl-L-alanyl-D-glutamate--2,6-diaminopimelate ligase [Clostridia bacterium]|nr:UDP-N-acetylmuramoyl-L-alanyl-D-glutamate--2,6-diaminopimelate ligase [Clostridia bacterium]
MKLSNISKAVNGKLFGDDLEIAGLSIDSRLPQKDKIFICFQGKRTNSQKFVLDAKANGATAIITENKLSVDIPQIVVGDARKAYSLAAAEYYGYPQKDMKIVAVTGTNGKTTTAYLLKKVFDEDGKKAAYIGTLFADYDGKREETSLTTPDPDVLFELLSKMKQAKVEYVFLEASAHALYLKKLESIVFDAAVLTNVTRDHLDFFGDMETYADAKKSLFTQERTKLGIINADDRVGLEILKHAEIPCVSYGLLNPADVFALDVVHDHGLTFTVNMCDVVFTISTVLYGSYNVENVLAVCTVAGYFGVKPSSIAAALKNADVPGRFNVYENKGVKAVIDYAHTADGLKKLLLSALDMTKNRLITVFGCGGERDKGKRAAMGRIAEKYSDYVFITNDNPRSENQYEIAAAIEAGMLEDRKKIVLDREEAIKQAVEMAVEGDVIVIAGKGSEQYMEIAGEKIPFQDEAVLKKYFL